MINHTNRHRCPTHIYLLSFSIEFPEITPLASIFRPNCECLRMQLIYPIVSILSF